MDISTKKIMVFQVSKNYMNIYKRFNLNLTFVFGYQHITKKNLSEE